MRVVAIVQARVGSSRLPGKVLADIEGQTMLARVVARLAASDLVTETVIATSIAPENLAVVAEAERLGVASVRGSETDVLARYLDAARASDADVVVRVTADCPLLDPHVVDLVVDALRPDVDYASNTLERTYPRGLDVEALHRDTLERIARLGVTPAAREHVTAFVMEQPALFRTRQVRGAANDSDLRWTVDTEQDLALVRELYRYLGAELLPYREVVTAVRAHPALLARNADVQQKAWR